MSEAGGDQYHLLSSVLSLIKQLFHCHGVEADRGGDGGGTRNNSI